MSTKYEALKLENQLCFPLYAASREIVKAYYPYLSEIGLTYTQYVTMMVLWEEGSASVKSLGERLHLDSGTLTPLLKQLEKKGLIRRHRWEEDERVLIASLTDKGRELEEKASEVPSKVAGCFSLEPDEAAELYRLLYKLLDSQQ